MYDELVKTLRNNADHYGFVGENGLVHLLTNAADAIEELSKRSECPCWYGGIRFCSMLGKPIPEPPKEE